MNYLRMYSFQIFQLKSILIIFSFLFFVQKNSFSNEILFTLAQNEKIDSIRIQNLATFAKACGYIKLYYYVKTTEDEWDYFLLKNIDKIINSANEIELINNLNDIFQTIAPLARFYISESNDSIFNLILSENKGKLFYYWHHRGYGNHAYRGIQKLLVPYKSKLKRTRENAKINSYTPCSKKINTINIDNIYLAFPECIAKNKVRQLNSDYIDNRIYDNNILETKQITVINTWNVIKHFFPYWEQVNINWEDILFNTLYKVSQEDNIYEFHKILSSMVATLGDAHAGFWLNNKHAFELPIDVEWIDNKLIVTKKENNDETEHISIGDVLISVNENNANTLFKSQMALEPLGSNISPYKAANNILKSFNGDTSLLKLIDSQDSIYFIKLNHGYNWENPKATWNITPSSLTQLDSNIFYTQWITKREFKRNINEINQSNGLICDFRSYPGYMLKGLGHLSTEKLFSPSFLYPIITKPKNIKNESDTSVWNITPKNPKITVPVVFLIDGNTISMGETYALIIKHYNLGTLIGERTAGVTGEMNLVRLSSKASFTFTGCKVLDQSGAVFYNTGIIPDIYVEKTIEGIRNGKDEILEKAKEFINNLNNVESN